MAPKICDKNKNFNLMVTFSVPPRWILEPTDKAFAQGSDAKVECKADGFPKPQVTWKRAEGRKFILSLSKTFHEDRPPTWINM